MFKRWIAFILCFAMLQTVGCSFYYWGKVEVPVDENLAQVTKYVLSVVTKEGEVFEFKTPGAKIRNEFVVGTVVGGEVEVIPLGEVQRIWVFDKKLDMVKSVVASVAVTAGVILVTGGVVVAIVMATKNSCPFVYSWDGKQFVFDAEPYGGATTKGLERDDFSELQHLAPCDGVYKLRVTNEVPETQCTNLMELLVVDHAPQLTIAPDKSGQFHTLADPEPPVTIQDQLGQDLRPWLAATDRLIWEPLPEDLDADHRPEIVMTFRKPPGATRAKLVVNVATGQLGARLIRELLELQGCELDAFYDKLDNEPEEKGKLIEWLRREGLYLLDVEVEAQGRWQIRGILEGEGPLISEHRVIPLDLRGVTGDLLRVRIRPPLGFWALNSFAVDYSSDQKIHTRVVPATKAMDSEGNDLLSDLRATDDRYWSMPDIGNSGTIEFPVPPLQAGLRRTVFLHSRGYYKLHLPKTDREPDHERLAELEATPGGAVRLAAARLAAIRSEAVAR